MEEEASAAVEGSVPPTTLNNNNNINNNKKKEGKKEKDKEMDQACNEREKEQLSDYSNMEEQATAGYKDSVSRSKLDDNNIYNNNQKKKEVKKKKDRIKNQACNKREKEGSSGEESDIVEINDFYSATHIPFMDFFTTDRTHIPFYYCTNLPPVNTAEDDEEGEEDKIIQNTTKKQKYN